MASSRPDFLPAWATASFALAVSGQQNKVRPAAGWRANGWDENEEPPCNYENWQMNRVYQWLEFFDNNLIRSAAAFVVASDAPDQMKDLGTSEGTGVAKYICDGVDDDVQIQAAINDVLAAGVGGVVLLSEGTFELESGLGIVAANDVVICGMGRGATVLKVADGQLASWDVITLTTVENSTIRDLSIDGNKGNQAGVFAFSGIVMDAATHCVVRDVEVHDMYVDAVLIGTAFEVKGASVNCILARCRAYSNTATNVDIKITAGIGSVVERCRVSLSIQVTAPDTRIADNYVTGESLLIDTGGDGSMVRGNRVTAGTSGILIENVDGVMVDANLVSNVDENGILTLASENLQITNNMIKLCGFNGIQCTTTDDSEIANNHIDSCSQAGDGVHSGIKILDGCDDISITGNVVRTKGAANDHFYGVFVLTAGAPNPSGIWIVNNDLKKSSKVLSGAAAPLGNELSDAGGHSSFPGASGGHMPLANEPLELYDATAAAHTPSIVHFWNRIQ